MVKGIIGKKVGITQLFDESGKVIPITVIEAGPCTVVQKKTVENDSSQAGLRRGFRQEGQQGSCRPLQEGKRCPQEDPARVPSGRCFRNERWRRAEG